MELPSADQVQAQGFDANEERSPDISKQHEEISKLVQVIFHRPFDEAVIDHHRMRQRSRCGFHLATLCRLTTLTAVVYIVVQTGILLVDTFDLLSSSQDFDAGPPKVFDIVYFAALMLLLLSAFVAIFGIIFYRAYLTVPFILCGLCAFCLLSGLLNYSMFQPPERLYSTFTTAFPDHRLNALCDIIMVGLATYITLCNVREQVMYDLPPVCLSRYEQRRRVESRSFANSNSIEVVASKCETSYSGGSNRR